ncbi:MAG: hypothetical protein GC137_06225 [Alphaproteobacteria bacterium]|nr:hypothetical protein [Alphaproteobacteria bacterium]
MALSNGLRGLLLAAFTTLAGCATTSKVEQDRELFQLQQTQVMDLGLKGNHQFTVLAAPDYCNVFALQLLHDHLEQMEKSGVKHVILKTHPFSRLVPDGISFDAQKIGESGLDFLARASARLDQLETQADALSGVRSFGQLKAITGNDQAAKVVKLVQDMASKGISYGQDFYTALTANLKAEVQGYRDIIERRRPLEELLATPSDENAQKLRDLSHFVFQADNLGSQEQSRQYAALLVEVIIEAQKRGINVHLAGDNVGAPGTVKQAEIAFRGHVGEFSKFIEENPDLTVHLKALAQLKGTMGIDDYLRSLNLDEDKRKGLKERLEKFRLLESGDAQGKPGVLTKRFSEGAEQARAASLVALAGGERAVIVWDPVHFFKGPGNGSGLPHGKDVNEFLDEALKAAHDAKVAAAATPEDKAAIPAFEPTRVVEVYKSGTDYELIIKGYGDLYKDRPDARYLGDQGLIVEEPTESAPQ